LRVHQQKCVHIVAAEETTNKSDINGQIDKSGNRRGGIMANLFWKKDSQTKRLIEAPFKTEAEFEEAIFGNAELLEDIFLLKRQVRGGNKPGVPDIIGIDGDGNICIVEMKNVAVDASIIPQVLEYAIWAETNPDSIKSLWLECENKPDDLEIDWDHFDVRIIIIAPEIDRVTLQYVERINYPVDLLEVKRWVEGDNQFIMVNQLEQRARKGKVRPVRGMTTYDKDFYRTERNAVSTEAFMQYAHEVQAIIQKRGWPLETRFKKNYCAFATGFFNVFSIRWMGTKTFAFVFKFSQKEANEFAVPLTKYDSQRNRAFYYVEPNKTKVHDFIPLIEYAYKRFAGG
jgi:hypothetical protein